MSIYHLFIKVDPGELDNYVEEEQEEEENLILEEEVVSYKTLEIPILKINTGITVDKGKFQFLYYTYSHSFPEQ